MTPSETKQAFLKELQNSAPSQCARALETLSQLYKMLLLKQSPLDEHSTELLHNVEQTLIAALREHYEEEDTSQTRTHT